MGVDEKSRAVARIWGLEGKNAFLGGRDFCFYYIFKTNFYGNKKICVGLSPNATPWPKSQPGEAKGAQAPP